MKMECPYCKVDMDKESEPDERGHVVYSCPKCGRDFLVNEDFD